MNPPRLGVLVSGGGTTLQNLIDREAAGALDGTVVVVISSKPAVKGLDRAASAGLPHHVVSARKLDAETFSTRITEILDGTDVDLVILGGFLRLWDFPDRYRGRVMNIHPALLPDFGGKGMHGAAVHRAVLDSGVPETGCTVHFADHEYDQGPVIVQKRCPVEPGDTPEDVAARVFALECEAYPEAIALFAAGRLKVNDGRVEILGG